MTTFTPFAGAHVHPDFVRRVPAPAVDSLSREQRRDYLKSHPDSYLLVTRAPADGGPSEDVEPAKLIELGAENLERLLRLGAFVEVPGEVFFLYEINHRGHQQIGIAGLVDVDDYRAGRVKKHELVDTERAAHLAHHFEAVGAQSSAIAMGYRRDEPISRWLDDAIERLTPRIEFTSGDDAHQRVWVVDDESDLAFLGRAFEGHDLYLMDGHHRAAAAALFNASAPTSPASRHMLALLLAGDRINIEPFHRHVVIPPELDLDETTRRIAELLNLVPEPAVATEIPELPGGVGVYMNGGWWAGQLPDPVTSDPVAMIEPVRLQRAVLGPVLGIDPSAPGGHLDYFLESSDRRSMVAGAGPRDLYFVLRPVTADEVFAVADAGLDMPPKSTYVTPKPRSGVLLRRF